MNIARMKDPTPTKASSIRLMTAIIMIIGGMRHTPTEAKTIGEKMDTSTEEVLNDFSTT